MPTLASKKGKSIKLYFYTALQKSPGDKEIGKSNSM